ncbi:lipopolysaccharide assembly protein LapA domain-containing protein [Rhodococcus sp. HNM0569]|uniref:lipopolysaccharide assembly protein LapA domain-containing protein n=1 Tax=Rhodococcus sp. HNM0569 TaxID=2716340 RepID=UPI00146CFD14|nr:DUF1049 domain-containing protein [Rhodococcus sp. HNM0569]
MSVAQWVALVVTVLALVFVLQNRDRVTIHLLQIEVGSPMWLVLLVMFVAGWLAGVLVRWRRGRRG